MKTQDYIKMLTEFEPAAIRFLPNIVWASADGYYVTDTDGKKRVDFCSGAMIANSGHNNKAIINAIKKQLDTGVYTTYLFPNIPRCELLSLFSTLIPPNYLTALFNTGAEAVESAVKIARVYAYKVLKNKGTVISFNNSYHGRLIGSTAISGTESIKYWIPMPVQEALSIQVPFPSCPYESKPHNFNDFLNSIHEKNIDVKDIAAVIIEPYQGSSCAFLPRDFSEELRQWCDRHKILIISDEVQSGMGRTGKLWGYEHLGITPDLIVAGKGLSACLPISAVSARKDLFDLCEPGNFNSTHSGNPICSSAAIANIHYMLDHKLVENAEKMGILLNESLMKIKNKYPWFIGHVLGKGLAYAILIDINYKHLLKALLDRCIKNGVLLIGGGFAGTTIKIVPPLIIDATGIKKGCEIIEKSVQEIIEENNLGDKSHVSEKNL